MCFFKLLVHLLFNSPLTLVICTCRRSTGILCTTVARHGYLGSTFTVVKRPQFNADFRDLGRTRIKEIDEISVIWL